MKPKSFFNTKGAFGHAAEGTNEISLESGGQQARISILI
jgi:uncharacterized lipoprotein NlpE involved in copper resistance